MSSNLNSKKLQMVKPVALSAGDVRWAEYAASLAEFRSAIPTDAYQECGGTLKAQLKTAWLTKIRLHSLEAIREYLGVGAIRSYSRESKVFTLAYMERLRAQNLAERIRREPYFVKMAALYEQINQLEA